MLGDLSNSQLKLLQEFKDRVSDVEKDEANCLRFLIAREFKLDLAEAMLRNSLKWRKDVGIENYLKWNPTSSIPEAPPEDFQFESRGIGYNGSPVIWIPIARWNARSWIEKGRGEEISKFGFHILETILTAMKDAKTPATVILGIETLTYHKVAHMPSLKLLHQCFQTLEQNYPEILQHLLIVNAPWLFSIAWNVISPILSERTHSKIQIFGSDNKQWLPVLRKLMPDEVIPQDYLSEDI